jgi:hypothetical protein
MDQISAPIDIEVDGRMALASRVPGTDKRM